MGRTARWLKALFSGSTSRRKESSNDPTPDKKKGWSFSGRRGLSYREKPFFQKPANVVAEEESKRAIAVAAASAAVAEAAVVAAEAAAAVVRLTSWRGRSCADFHESRTEVWAALKIQSAFRGYLARRALKALKGLVKIQALVRGYIVRKQAADYLRCMQSLVRAQTRARAGRVPQVAQQPIKPSDRNFQESIKHERREHLIRDGSTRMERRTAPMRNESRVKRHGSVKERVMRSPDWKWLDRWMDEHHDSDKEKILEVDAGGSQMRGKWRRKRRHSVCFSNQNNSRIIAAATPESPSKDSTTARHSGSSVDMPNHYSSTSLGFFPQEADSFSSSRPRLGGGGGGGAKSGPFTPSKSECSWSCLSGFSDHPNYMSNTQSSRAKSRSLSAPRQRPELEKKLSSVRRNQVGGYGSQRLDGIHGVPTMI